MTDSYYIFLYTAYITGGQAGILCIHPTKQYPFASCGFFSVNTYARITSLTQRAGGILQTRTTDGISKPARERHSTRHDCYCARLYETASHQKNNNRADLINIPWVTKSPFHTPDNPPIPTIRSGSELQIRKYYSNSNNGPAKKIYIYIYSASATVARPIYCICKNTQGVVCFNKIPPQTECDFL